MMFRTDPKRTQVGQRFKKKQWLKEENSYLKINLHFGGLKNAHIASSFHGSFAT